MLSKRGVFTGHGSIAAHILNAHFKEVIIAYKERLLAIESPLLVEAKTREQTMAQARSVLKEVTAVLGGGREVSPSMQLSTTPLSEATGISNASSNNIHTFHLLRAAVAFSEAALRVVVDNLLPSPTSTSEVAAVALAIQGSFMESVMRTEAQPDQRRRISRDLHDKLAPTIMMVFRNLELHEIYRAEDPLKAQSKLELAKSMTQEALQLTRDLSCELRSTSAEEGVEVALSRFLRVTIPENIQFRVSVKGDESRIMPRVRDELFLILREGIRNAVTHAKGCTLTVEVDVIENQVEATVEDDGIGFLPREGATQLGSMGITSMEERTALLGGNLTLASERGKGTKIKIFLPLLPGA